MVDSYLWTSLIPPAPPRGWLYDIECGGNGCVGPAVVWPLGPDKSVWGCWDEACWLEPTWTDRIAASISFRRCHHFLWFRQNFSLNKLFSLSDFFFWTLIEEGQKLSIFPFFLFLMKINYGVKNEFASFFSLKKQNYTKTFFSAENKINNFKNFFNTFFCTFFSLSLPLVKLLFFSFPRLFTHLITSSNIFRFFFFFNFNITIIIFFFYLHEK